MRYINRHFTYLHIYMYICVYIYIYIYIYIHMVIFHFCSVVYAAIYSISIHFRGFWSYVWLREREDFEMKIWRKMEKIIWIDKVTNEEVLRTVNEDRQILNSIWQSNINGLAMLWDMIVFCMKLLKAECEMVNTFTYRPSLVKIDARNFELSW